MVARIPRHVPRELINGQTEDYVEYSRTGQIVKGKERAKARSKYPEDVYVNNHTDVWGSWYDISGGTWGYACCHSTIHISYCAGEAQSEPSAQDNEARARIDQNYSKKRVGDGDVSLDKDRLAEAISEEKKRKARGDKDDDRYSKKIKSLQSGSHDVTEEEFEAYRMTRRNAEDPMANYVDSEDVYTR
ncbi:hypothetical protein DFH29DRAFT_1013285 [Suillus ampliporus]|nr:hypothetical protein DFH29DRAFT_1013285 [Suillus ampliporus]